jgi:hypothetical protein
MQTADRCARYLLGGGAAIPFAADGSNQAALIDRLGQALATKPVLEKELLVHLQAVNTAYAGRPIASVYYGPPYAKTPAVELGTRPSSRGAYYDVRGYEVAVLSPSSAMPTRS